MSGDRPKRTVVTVGGEFDLDGDTVASTDGSQLEGEQRHLEPGSQVGRYMILGELGRGGMGVVYKAYDPELDRRIALKLLSVKSNTRSRGDRARNRLLREAKALAQLSHPNVVSAYDVGTHEGDVFVAMELVEGLTLREWIRDRQPSIWERVQTMTAAGRGIAAAHQAGLIHRDIKSDNIIVGDDGRVRVLDFGLARAAIGEEKPADPLGERVDSSTARSRGPVISGELTSGGSFLSDPMTHAGVIVGTPGYMAPEQYLGGQVDEQSDQYSFCVTLYEALFGRRPYVAKRYTSLRDKVLSGKIDPVATTSKIPKRFRRVILRGLFVAREDRFPSMTALLDELDKDPRLTRRRRLTFAAVILSVGLSFGGAYAWQAQQQRLCAGAAEHLIGTWDQETKQKTQAAFLASGRPYAKDTFGRVEKILDQLGHDWTAMRTEACQATHLRGEQSESLLDRRMQCLDRRLGEMQALSGLFTRHPDAEVVDQAVQSAHDLADLSRCADGEALMAAVPPPTDPKVRARVVALRKKLHESAALAHAGKCREALAMAAPVSEKARALSFAPFLAEALFQHGSLLDCTGKPEAAVDYLHQALIIAAKAKDDHLLALTANALCNIVGTKLARHAEALAMNRLALANVFRAGQDPSLHIKALGTRAIIFAQQNKFEQARSSLEQSLRIAEKTYGPDHYNLAAVLNNLGNILVMQGQNQEARKLISRALAINEKILGPEHPNVGRNLHNLGRIFLVLGDYDQAREQIQRSLGILQRALGNEHPELTDSYDTLGAVYFSQGELDEAQEYYQRALTLGKKILRAGHPDLGRYTHNLALVYREKGEYQKAEAFFRQALSIWEKALGPSHPHVAQVLENLISVYEKQGRQDRSARTRARLAALRPKTPR